MLLRLEPLAHLHDIGMLQLLKEAALGEHPTQVSKERERKLLAETCQSDGVPNATAGFANDLDRHHLASESMPAAVHLRARAPADAFL